MGSGGYIVVCVAGEPVGRGRVHRCHLASRSRPVPGRGGPYAERVESSGSGGGAGGALEEAGRQDVRGDAAR